MLNLLFDYEGGSDTPLQNMGLSELHGIAT
jgi:hypothetical protein